MNRVRPWIILLLPLLLAAPAVSADAHLVLRDGQVLSGVSVELQGELYLLTLESGDVLPLPVPLVAEVHRSVQPAGPADEGEDPGVLPVLEAELVPAAKSVVPSEDLGVPERPRRLIELPDDGRSSSTFSRSLVDPQFVPESAYAEQPMLGVFGESFWSGGPIAPHWNGESGFELPEGEPTKVPVLWNPASQRAIWKPKDGFADDGR